MKYRYFSSEDNVLRTAYESEHKQRMYRNLSYEFNNADMDSKTRLSKITSAM